MTMLLVRSRFKRGIYVTLAMFLFTFAFSAIAAYKLCSTDYNEKMQKLLPKALGIFAFSVYNFVELYKARTLVVRGTTITISRLLGFMPSRQLMATDIDRITLSTKKSQSGKNYEILSLIKHGKTVINISEIAYSNYNDIKYAICDGKWELPITTSS